MSKGTDLINEGLKLEIRKGIDQSFDLFEKMIRDDIKLHEKVKSELDDEDKQVQTLMCDSGIFSLKNLLEKVIKVREKITHD